MVWGTHQSQDNSGLIQCRGTLNVILPRAMSHGEVLAVLSRLPLRQSIQTNANEVRFLG